MILTISDEMRRKFKKSNLKKIKRTLWKFFWAILSIDLIVVIYKTVLDYIINYIACGLVLFSHV